MTDPTASALQYQSGFGNHFATEAVAGALPVGRNSPQRAPLGLYAEVLSGTAFTAPRAQNHRTWMYRMRPSAMQPAYRRGDDGTWKSSPINDAEVPANRLRWNPLPVPTAPTDFIDGIFTVAGNGDVASQTGVTAHVYCANRSMERRYLVNSDGEMLLVSQAGALLLHTEMGRLAVAPGEIALIPRGLRFRVELLEAEARGYMCENYGAGFRSARTAWPTRATSWHRWQPTKTTTDRSKWSTASRDTTGPPRWATRRSTWWHGTATLRPASTTWRASW